MSTSDPVELATALMRVHRQVRTVLGAVARDLDLTVQQAELMCVLSTRNPSFGELAELLGCDKTNITGLVDRLVRRGLVARRVDDADRRVTRLELTPAGAAFEPRIKEAMAVAVEEHWGSLSTGQRSALDAIARTGSSA